MQSDHLQQIVLHCLFGLKLSSKQIREIDLMEVVQSQHENQSIRDNGQHQQAISFFLYKQFLTLKNDLQTLHRDILSESLNNKTKSKQQNYRSPQKKSKKKATFETTVQQFVVSVSKGKLITSDSKGSIDRVRLIANEDKIQLLQDDMTPIQYMDEQMDSKFKNTPIRNIQDDIIYLQSVSLHQIMRESKSKKSSKSSSKISFDNFELSNLPSPQVELEKTHQTIWESINIVDSDSQSVKNKKIKVRKHAKTNTKLMPIDEEVVIRNPDYSRFRFLQTAIEKYSVMETNRTYQQLLQENIKEDPYYQTISGLLMEETIQNFKRKSSPLFENQISDTIFDQVDLEQQIDYNDQVPDQENYINQQFGVSEIHFDQLAEFNMKSTGINKAQSFMDVLILSRIGKLQIVDERKGEEYSKLLLKPI